MPRFRLRSDTDPRVVEAQQYLTEPEVSLPSGVRLDSHGGSPSAWEAHTFDAYGRRVEVREGDWVYPDRGGRGYVVSDDATFRRGWEAVEASVSAPIDAKPGGIWASGGPVGYECQGAAFPVEERPDVAGQRLRYPSAPPATPEPAETPTQHANLPDDAADAQGDHA